MQLNQQFPAASAAPPDWQINVGEYFCRRYHAPAARAALLDRAIGQVKRSGSFAGNMSTPLCGGFHGDFIG
jgi:hypothetical protein